MAVKINSRAPDTSRHKRHMVSMCTPRSAKLPDPSLSRYLYIYLSIYLSIYFIYLSMYVCIYLSIYIFYLFIYLSIYLLCERE